MSQPLNHQLPPAQLWLGASAQLAPVLLAYLYQQFSSTKISASLMTSSPASTVTATSDVAGAARTAAMHVQETSSQTNPEFTNSELTLLKQL
ncbi:MAG TPA: hypothetical protein VJJ83_00730, partial [Candidatus Babeliales bacterium]|nr:hypothetical protein [Candidatus Babeliales bacterium]